MVIFSADAHGALGALRTLALEQHPQSSELQTAVANWQKEWEAGRLIRELDPTALWERVVQKLHSLSWRPRAIVALWDGDTSGWFIVC